MRTIRAGVAAAVTAGLLLGTVATAGAATAAPVEKSTHIVAAKKKAKKPAKAASYARTPTRSAADRLARALEPLNELSANGMEVCNAGSVDYIKSIKSARVVFETDRDVNGGYSDVYAADPNGDGLDDVLIIFNRGRGYSAVSYTLGVQSWDPKPARGQAPWGYIESNFQVYHNGPDRQKIVNCFHSEGEDWEWRAAE